MITLLVLLALTFTSTDASAQNQFYQGKTITVISTSSTGSAYDIYARLVAQFMGKHIPGNPNFIAQNMPGAGSLIGTNYLYGLAKGDGTVIGGLQPSMYFNQLYKQPEAKYDWAKFNWLGSSDQSESLLYMRADLPYKTHGGCAQGQGAAQMRLHRPRHFRNLYAQTDGRTARDEIHHHLRLQGRRAKSIWRWNGASSSAAPSRFRRTIPASPTTPGARPASRAS